MEKKKLSHIVQDKIKEVENKIVPGVTWDKQKSWEKIKEVLTSKNKQLIMWYFATAASVSILVAASMDTTLPYFQKVFDMETPAEIVKSEALKEFQIAAPDKKPVKPIDRIASKKLSESNDFFHSKCAKHQIKSIGTSGPESNMSIDNFEEPTSPLKVLPQINSNVAAPFAPGFSVDYRFYFGKQPTWVRYIAIGTSSNLIYRVNPENSGVDFYPATFINAKYGQKKLINNRTKEWELGAGYLVNPDQVIYKDTTFRFQYLKTITGKLKAGPELILTNNLTRLYPGFTLTFG